MKQNQNRGTSFLNWCWFGVFERKYIGAGLACSGLIGAGAGIGLIFSSLIASTARNPQLRGQLFTFAILGFALAEATGLFSLMIAFLLLYS